jgi:hypothetical protein
MATLLTSQHSTRGHLTCFGSPYSSGGSRSPRPKFARATEVLNTRTAQLPRWNNYYAAWWLGLEPLRGIIVLAGKDSATLLHPFKFSGQRTRESQQRPTASMPFPTEEFA